MMRIVIDMQGTQTENRFRGIGRYALSLALAMVRNRGEHEILIALNGFFPDTIESVRVAFDGLLPQENIRVWCAVSPVAGMNTANDWRRKSAELVREAFLASLGADIVVVLSLFEGFWDNAVTSIGTLSRVIPTAVTLYDLIPYIYPKPYLENPALEVWYIEKIAHLRRADLWLAISECSRKEGIDHINLPEERVINVSTDADTHFQQREILPIEENAIRQKYGLERPFVMYTGGIDHRKNIEGLIRAFAKLPTKLRKAHQLAIICTVQPESRNRLERLAIQQGLNKDEVILTGFVTEEDLVTLYNLSTLFIFPSWHEGFGLPALEAMRCGAPVIGANTSSLPEVIGWEDALFDPHSDDSISLAIERALSDPVFRAELIYHGKKQSMKFSWDASASRSIAAMERLYAERQARPECSISVRRPRLAYVSPLPPEKSGIADYSAELLPELARQYEIEVIVAQDVISEPWVKENCPTRTVQWFVENSDRYERVLYHFGNSTYHCFLGMKTVQHMFELLKVVPGVVVLHDFFLSGITAHIDMHGYWPDYWAQELYLSHGYTALRDRFHAKETADIVWRYPCSLSVIQDSLGIIVHSPNSLRLAEQWYGGKTTDWAQVPLMRDTRISADRTLARKVLGFDDDDFLVCTFGILGPNKLNLRLMKAWLKSRLARDKSCHLVFVGENHPGEYGEELLKSIRHSGLKRNIHITGWVDITEFRQYLAAADVGVQLRSLSRGETSAAVLDCMNYGLATIVNAHGNMADLSDDAVWKLPDEFSDEQLIEALETLRNEPARRHGMGEAARSIILRDHNPRTCAEQYGDAIERFYQAAISSPPILTQRIAGVRSQSPDNADLMLLADAIARNFPPRQRQRQLLIDISELVRQDVGTGIQRAVRSILNVWLNESLARCRVEPVYASVDQAYRYARRFTLNFMNCPNDILRDEPIEYAPGDIFLCLDLQPSVVSARRSFFQELHRQGVLVKFVVYDLLCVQMPQYFANGAEDGFSRWLEIVSECDGAVCISKTVADELTDLFKEKNQVGKRPFKVDWVHLGADVDNSVPSTGLPKDAKTVLARLRGRKNFLIVGTLEPRKGHKQVLEAFEKLWQLDQDVNLVIVGKQGWMVEALVKRLRVHSELNKRLFWLEGISDEYLEKVYAASTCLIAASYGEGFGLPLIEAAQHKLPIIARDIPVFREVAGEYAHYFAGRSPDDLAVVIKTWLDMYEAHQHPKSDGMPWLSWKESANRLLSCLGISVDQ